MTQETPEEAAARHFNKEDLVEGVNIQYVLQSAFIEGAKWQADKMYSEEEVISAMKNSYGIKYFSERKFLENLKQFKKK